ncbi:MAG: hypothetical protein HRU13_13475 [Phycisphaerales bacterium]|nr:hypothetical protein [Phycisphaerales bacterium]
MPQMHRCLLIPALERVRVNGFAFPLGVYPVEPVAPRTGFTVDFEPADGDEEWEEWPDRYVYEILVSAERLKPLCSAVLSLLPGRVYPILDVLGNDAFREIDPYIAYELVGVESLYDGLRWYEPFLFEDGLCGFGAMSEDPFMYLFLDEHKVLTIRVETAARERIDRLLSAFDLPNLAGDEKEGQRPRRADGHPLVEVMAADAVSHEHRSVLLTPEDRPELPGPEEVTEALVDLWGMTLNIDVERNLDDDGRDLGVTGWRCLVRVEPPMPEVVEAGGPSTGASAKELGEPMAAPTATTKAAPASAGPSDSGEKGGEVPRVRYAEALVAAKSWREAEDLALRAATELPGGPRHTSPTDEESPRLVAADRLWRREVVALLSRNPAGPTGNQNSPQSSTPEAHTARGQDAAPGEAGEPSPASDGPVADPEDPHQPEPPEIAGLLDEALANGADGRILRSRWLE